MEITVVLIVLALGSLVLFPRWVAMRDSADRQAFRTDAARIFSQASQSALARGQAVRIAWRNGLEVQAADDEAGGSGTGLDLPEIGAEEGQAIARVEAIPGIDPDILRRGAEDLGEEVWSLTFEPDGRAEAGGIQFREGDRTFWFLVESDGTVREGLDELPLQQSEEWDAGELEQRA